MSAAASTSTISTRPEVHFLVLVHGMWGNVQHLAEAARIIREVKGDKDQDGRTLEVLVAETNQEESTYDGFDWGGERVADEVEEAVAKIEESGRKVTRFSVTGYSLGGLISRYMIGVLYQRGFFETHTPANFNTFATPHIGLPQYPNWISKLGSVLGPRILSRSGEQFYAVDKWSKSGRPLLEVMADPKGIFYEALSMFPNARIYANAVNDRTVPYVTAAIEFEDPFLNPDENGIVPSFNEKYKPIMASFAVTSAAVAKKAKPKPLSKQWFVDIKDHKPAVPPFLQFRFPGNLLIYLAWPILFPTFISLAILRLSLSSRASRRRIKLLEGEDAFKTRLVNVLAGMEKEVEDVLVDMMNDPGSAARDDPAAAATTTTISASPATGASEAKDKKDKKGPVLTPVQRQCATWLNTLPNLKKEVVFIHPTLNAHAVIISRDPARFPAHKDGEGVLRHWADHFEL